MVMLDVTIVTLFIKSARSVNRELCISQRGDIVATYAERLVAVAKHSTTVKLHRSKTIDIIK